MKGFAYLNKKILHSAIGLLSRREHSTKELTQKLSLRKFELDEISVVVDYLLEEDYLSNERFAESILRTRVNKGYGWLYIKNELSQKGVSSSIIYELKNNQQIDWYLQAELAYNKRFGTTAVTDQKDKAKRARFLQGRGFSSDEIFSLL